jgi:coiled-coil domain-containing protein 41
MAAGVSLSASLPRLVQETELQKMLADEKMRSEQHKTNYKTLKEEHKRLQDECMALHKELTSTIADCKLVQEKYTKLLEQARSELAAKISENEQLRMQVVNPKMVESLKLQVHGEVEKPFHDKLAQLERDLEKFRAENKKLKYDYSFLKSEYEHQRQEHQRVVEELTLRYEAEVTNLRHERESTLARQQQDAASDVQHVRTVQRENIQLNQKVKSLLTELDELRSQREHVGLQADSVTRLQIKQLAEHTATIKALETEKQSLKTQHEAVHRELAIATDENTRLSARVHELEKENVALRSRAEETVHRSKLDVSNVRVEMLRERGDVERERDRLGSQLQDALAEIEVLKVSMSQLETTIVDKERELQRRVQAAREEEWQKFHKAESEKLELESRVHELEKLRADCDAARIVAIEKAEDRLKKALDEKDAAEREALVARTKLENQLQLLDSLERERAETAELRTRFQRLESQYNTYVSGERELIELNERLEHESDELRTEVQRVRESAQHEREQADGAMAQYRAAWLEEKCNLQSRIDELDVELAAARKKLVTSTHTYKQKKNRMKGLVSKLRDRITHLQLTVDQLQVEKEAIKRSLPGDAHEQLKRRLCDLLQRNREFRALLLAGNIKPTSIGGLTFGCVGSSDQLGMSMEPFDILPSLGTFFDTKQKDLCQIRDRLDHLDIQQRQQMEELKGNPTYGGTSGGGQPRCRDESPVRSVDSDRTDC